MLGTGAVYEQDRVLPSGADILVEETDSIVQDTGDSTVNQSPCLYGTPILFGETDR